MFSLTFSHSFWDVCDILFFQSNLCIVLAHGKSPKNSIHRDLFKTKTLKQKPHRPPVTFYVPQPDFPKLLKNVIFPTFLVNVLTLDINKASIS